MATKINLLFCLLLPTLLKIFITQKIGDLIVNPDRSAYEFFKMIFPDFISIIHIETSNKETQYARQMLRVHKKYTVCFLG